MHSAHELAANIAHLYPLPTVYACVREELDAPNGSSAAVARILSADAAMTANVLRLVNSAFYGYGGKIAEIGRAVTLLGLQQVHDLVLAISVSATFNALRPRYLDMEEFWRGSLMRGLAAREIGRCHGMLGSERLFVMGLLADIGHLVLHQTIPELAIEARRKAELESIPLETAERAVIGCNFAEVGAMLLSCWHLPENFAKVTGAQLNPRLAGEHGFEAAVVHLATHIAEADRENLASSAATQLIDPVIWSALEMEPAVFRSIRESAELELAAFLPLLRDAARARQ